MSHTHALGIDLHKRISTWKLVDDKRTVVWSKSVSCEPEDIESALNSMPVSAHGLKVALEPTCGWRWVSQILENTGCDVHIANPYRLRLIADSRQKTDSEDAKTLAEFVHLGYLPESWKAPEEIEEQRQLVRVRTSIIQSRTKIKNQINSLLTAKTPLSRHQNIECDLKQKELMNLIKEHTAHVHMLDKEIKRIASVDPVCKLLMSIPAVGAFSALAIKAEVGDFFRFPNAGCLASYAGIVPTQRSSGETVRYGRIAKTGSKLLRTVLIESAIRFRPQYDYRLNVFFERVKKERGAMRARVALAHKLLTIMFSMVRNNKPFVSSHDTTKQGDLV